MSLYAYDDSPRELGPAVPTCACCSEEWDGPDECPTCTPEGECDGCDVERWPTALLVMEDVA